MFEKIHFDGQFRAYQQKVLNGADRYLSDGKIHIVAAPGSGKTILGLELIRRLHESCIILSPTTTIRNQWIERFAHHFLGNNNLEEYVSYDLKRLAPVTSVTYQALHAAMERIKNTEDNEDYSAFDLIAEVKRCGIKTVCLDEAHHLQNEWQKALERFISALDGEIKVIALTATPPYDAKPNEWKHYIDVCGEIDEEIFVPELVKQSTLCPHQDFIYFNYPTEAETADFKVYRERVDAALYELLSSKLVLKAYKHLLYYVEDYDFLYSNTKELIAFLSLCNFAEILVEKKLIKRLTSVNSLPKPTPERLNFAIRFLIKGPLLSEADRDTCLQIFKRYSVVDRGEVELGLNEKLKKELISSLGKLKSVEKITKSEYESKKDGLRLLILTDFIKKESLSVVGSDAAPDTMSIVSIFETVRKTGISVGALSGSLVILPDSCTRLLENTEFTSTPLGKTGYSRYDFRANNREKVCIVGELFEKGIIHVLVGTKSLLGEGWDAPCVNSLILASFVGSFMLSNQMRGRAIRTDKNQPDKTANIWHLVTVERPHLYAKGISEKLILLANEDSNALHSCDFDTVSRRFNCFVAPNYDTGEIENGMSRITILKPPYDEKGIQKINDEMINRAMHSNLNDIWRTQLNSTDSAQLNEVSEISKKNKMGPFVFQNIVTVLFLLSICSTLNALFIKTAIQINSIDNTRLWLLGIACVLLCAVILYYAGLITITMILKHLNPVRSIRTLAECILNAMQDAALVAAGARVKVESDPLGTMIEAELLNASVHDQNIFHNAMRELLSPIENPRYLLIPRGPLGRLRYNCALACPDILGSKSAFVEYLAKRLRHSLGKLKVIYTRTEQGRKLILKCRKKAYITRNNAAVLGSRRRVSRWE